MRKLLMMVKVKGSYFKTEQKITLCATLMILT